LPCRRPTPFYFFISFWGPRRTPAPPPVFFSANGPFFPGFSYGPYFMLSFLGLRFYSGWNSARLPIPSVPRGLFGIMVREPHLPLLTFSLLFFLNADSLFSRFFLRPPDALDVVLVGTATSFFHWRSDFFFRLPAYSVSLLRFGSAAHAFKLSASHTLF